MSQSYVKNLNGRYPVTSHRMIMRLMQSETLDRIESDRIMECVCVCVYVYVCDRIGWVQSAINGNEKPNKKQVDKYVPIDGERILWVW